MVKKPTRRQGETRNILDMIFTNNKNIVNNVLTLGLEYVNVLPGIRDDDVAYFQVNLTVKRRDK